MKNPKALGIDLGKKSFHVAVADGAAPEQFSVHEIPFKVDNWRDKLVSLVPMGATVVLEPTGTYYAAPVLAALPRVHVWYANHDTAKYLRRLYLSKSKTDAIDARALAIAAAQIAAGTEVRGARLYRPEVAEPVAALRVLVSNYVKATRETTRALNRLDAIMHSIAPEIVPFKAKYAAAVAANPALEVDPAALIEAGRPANMTGQGWGHQRRMLEKIAEYWRWPYPATVEALRALALDLHFMGMRREHAGQAIRETLARPPFVQIAALWSTVPLATPVEVAALLVACGGDPLSISKDQFTRACGVAPSRYQSGATDRTSKEARPGYRPAMAYLHLHMMGLISELAPANPIQEFRARGKSGGACKRKLAAIFHGIALAGEPCRW